MTYDTGDDFDFDGCDCQGRLYKGRATFISRLFPGRVAIALHASGVTVMVESIQIPDWEEPVVVLPPPPEKKADTSPGELLFREQAQVMYTLLIEAIPHVDFFDSLSKHMQEAVIDYQNKTKEELKPIESTTL